MNTISEPKVVIYSNEDSGYWNCSDNSLLLDVRLIFGRNEPFSRAVITLERYSMETNKSYWENIVGVPRDSFGEPMLPVLENGKTEILVEAYGESFNMVYESQETLEDKTILTCYSKAYKAKRLSLESICDFVYHDNNYYFKYIDVAGKELPVTGFDEATDADIITYSLNLRDDISFLVRREPDDSVRVEMIRGTGSQIFKLIAINGLGYNYEEIFCTDGYYYDHTAVSEEIKESYTEDEINTIKYASKIIEGADPILNYRVYNGNASNSTRCWDVITTLGFLSNRFAYFYDKAYFVDYCPDASHTLLGCKTFYKMRLDYGLDDEDISLSYTQDTEDSGQNQIDLYQIVDNKDQGSSYIQSNQRVLAENASVEISISTSSATVNGGKIFFDYADGIDNQQKIALCKRLALNMLVNNFRPMDCIQFIVSEVDGSAGGISADYVASTLEDLPIGVEANSIGLVQYGVKSTYYKYNGSAWELYNYYIDAGLRNERFPPYSFIKTVEDVQNGLTMNDVPLACTELLWPDCVTIYTFGNPKFMDSEELLSSLSDDTALSPIGGGEIFSISDRYASKIVIGNQTLSNLSEDREGFTGLIMEKNKDYELYRLSGYKDGVIQAYFNSDGEIMSGDGTVTINDNGIKIDAGGSYIDPSLVDGLKEWDSTRWYELGQTVIYQGKIYKAKSKNRGVIPGTDPDAWVIVVDTDTSAIEWKPDVSYAVGDIVYYEGLMYTAKQANTNVVPSESPTYWSQQAMSAWSPILTYNIGNIVAYKGSLYTALKASGNPPIEPGTNSSYWLEGAKFGNVSGKGYVILNNDGLTTYNNLGSPVCSVDTDGNIIGVKVSASNIQSGTLSSGVIYAGNINGSQVSGKVGSAGYSDSAGRSDSSGYSESSAYSDSAGHSGSSDYSDSAGDGYVVLDEDGLRTYSRTSHSSSYLQCSVGSDGAITAGQGAVKLDRTGLKTYNGDTVQCAVGTDGKLKFAGGEGSIGADGLYIPVGEGESGMNSVTFGTESNPTTVLSSYYADTSSNTTLNAYSSDHIQIGAFQNKKSNITRADSNIFIIPSSADYAPYFRVYDYSASKYTSYDISACSSDIPQSLTSSYTWYRKSIDGWMEMGGFHKRTGSESNPTPVTFNPNFVKPLYGTCTTIRRNSGDSGTNYVSGSTSSDTQITTTGMYCRWDSGNVFDNVCGFYWYACGKWR